MSPSSSSGSGVPDWLDPPETDRSLAVASAGVVGTAGVLALVVAASPGPDTSTLIDLGLVLGTAGGLAAVVVALVAIARAVLLDDHSSRWPAAGAVTFGALSLVVPHVVGAFVGGPNAVVTALDQSGQVVALALFAVGAFASGLEVLPGLVRLARAVGLAVVVLTGSFLLWPSLGAALALDRVGTAQSAGALVTVAAVVAWLAVAGAYAASAARDGGPNGWCVLLVLSLTLGRLAEAVAGSPDGGVWAAGLTLQAGGLLAASVLGVIEAARAFLADWEPAFPAEQSLSPLAAMAHLAEAGAPADELAEADSLPQVRAPGPTVAAAAEAPRPAVPMLLLELVEGVVSDLGLTDRVPVDVPADLVAAGSAPRTAAVVRFLLDNARDRSPHGGLRIRGHADGAWATLRVIDDGAPLSLEARRALSAGTELEGGGSTAAAVLAARRLVRADGGDLWVELGDDGRTGFAVCLPAIVPDADDLRRLASPI